MANTKQILALNRFDARHAEGFDAELRSMIAPGERQAKGMIKGSPFTPGYCGYRFGPGAPAFRREGLFG